MTRPLIVLGLVVVACAAPRASAADEVVVFRCTDASGRVSLSDEPCAKGQAQQRRTMVRPQDPPPRRASSRPSARDDDDDDDDRDRAPVREIVYRTPPRPLYECVTPDGERYTSRNDDGNPRWVTGFVGVPFGIGYGGGPRGGGVRRDVAPVIGRPSAPEIDRAPRPSSGDGRPPYGRPGYGYGYGIAEGVLVRDECFPLPQAEVCDRLRDERFELNRRYNSALQGERERIVREQRGIDAQLDADCGGA